MKNELGKIAQALGCELPERYLLERGGKPLLALPRAGEAAKRALDLYQPQRGLAKLTARLLREASKFGAHRFLLPAAGAEECETKTKLLPEGTDPESVGILFGSSEHRVFRAVLSYRVGDTWEVGKLAAGEDGAMMLDREAEAIRSISPQVPEIPELLGLEKAGDARLLRMPYIKGRALEPGNNEPVLRLLTSWLSDSPPQPLRSFPEWKAIDSALEDVPGGGRVTDLIGDLSICTSIRHGDLARWNLLITEEGDLKVLDWEWGEASGLPGIDLTHFLAQDFRLVERLSDIDVFRKTVHALQDPFWRNYLSATGWLGQEQALVIACLAFKQGAGHQQNEEILRSCVEAWLQS